MNSESQQYTDRGLEAFDDIHYVGDNPWYDEKLMDKKRFMDQFQAKKVIII